MKALSYTSRAPILLLLAAALTLPFMTTTYYLQFASKAMLLAILAVSLNLAVGYGGLVSMCHAAFFGLGGYMLGFLSSDTAAASLWLSLPVTLCAVATVAALIGALSLRTRGVYFIMVTLAFGEMLFYLFHDTKIGGGSDGMYIYFKPEITIGELTLLDLEDPRAFYYVTLACLVGATLLIRMLVSSPFGHALTAARENERRALSLGFPVFWIRLGAFIISASIAGLAGYFSAAQFGFVAPQLLGWHMSASVLVMVVLGGMSSVLGPIFGAIALLGLEEVLKAFFEHWKLIKGLIVIALVFALPGGLQQLASLLKLGSGELDTDPAPISVKEAAPHV